MQVPGVDGSDKVMGGAVDPYSVWKGTAVGRCSAGARNQSMLGDLWNWILRRYMYWERTD